MFRQPDHEELPSEVVILLAGVVGAGEAVVRRGLKRQEYFAIADPGEVRGDSFAHEDIPLIRGVRVRAVRWWRDEVADRDETMTRQILVRTHVGADG